MIYRSCTLHIRYHIDADLAVLIGALEENSYVIKIAHYEIHPRYVPDPNSIHHATNNIALLRLSCSWVLCLIDIYAPRAMNISKKGFYFITVVSSAMEFALFFFKVFNIWNLCCIAFVVSTLLCQDYLRRDFKMLLICAVLTDVNYRLWLKIQRYKERWFYFKLRIFTQLSDPIDFRNNMSYDLWD